MDEINLSLILPFLKYAGGKTQIMEPILSTIKKVGQITTYIEPFIGSGSVLFALIRSGFITQTTHIIISDMNLALINMYLDIKENPRELIRLIDNYLTDFNKSKEQTYTLLRGQFNKNEIPRINRSALFIFLNITCFNGLYRTNSKGEFNAPIGRNSNNSDTALNAQKRASILELSKVLNKYNITIRYCDYMESIIGVQQNNKVLIYLDPPYVPVKSNSFESYLGDFDHNRFFKFCRELKCNTLISNSNSIKVLIGLNHSGDDKKLKHNYRILNVVVRRMISSKSRDECFEILADNFRYISAKEPSYSHITNELVNDLVRILSE